MIFDLDSGDEGVYVGDIQKSLRFRSAATAFAARTS